MHATSVCRRWTSLTSLRCAALLRRRGRCLPHEVPPPAAMGAPARAAPAAARAVSTQPARASAGHRLAAHGRPEQRRQQQPAAAAAVTAAAASPRGAAVAAAGAAPAPRAARERVQGRPPPHRVKTHTRSKGGSNVSSFRAAGALAPRKGWRVAGCCESDSSEL